METKQFHVVTIKENGNFLSMIVEAKDQQEALEYTKKNYPNEKIHGIEPYN